MRRISRKWKEKYSLSVTPEEAAGLLISEVPHYYPVTLREGSEDEDAPEETFTVIPQNGSIFKKIDHAMSDMDIRKVNKKLMAFQ